jgi:hypothetical protein
MNYFPIAIVEEGTCVLRTIGSPEELPIGVPFRIVITNANPNDCRLIHDVLKHFRDKIGPYVAHTSH